MNYFTACSTVEKIKATWRRLAKQYHPDLGGDTRVMQDVNNQYHEALQAKHKTTSYDKETKKERTYYYDKDIEQAVMNKILELLGMRMDNVNVMLLGTWVWITGDTKPYKSKLGKEGAKCRWHKTKQAWYWRSQKNKCYRSSNAPLSQIAAMYGCKTFEAREQIA